MRADTKTPGLLVGGPFRTALLVAVFAGVAQGAQANPIPQGPMPVAPPPLEAAARPVEGGEVAQPMVAQPMVAKPEEAEPLAPPAPPGIREDGRIDLNRATVDELCTLPGIGKKRAEQILTYRDKRPFTRLTQLLRIRGIGKRTLERLRPLLFVDGVKMKRRRCHDGAGRAKTARR